MNLRKVQNITVVLPTHSIIIVEYIGDIQLSTELLSRDVLYVPQFTYNLLSVSALLKCGGFSIEFSGMTCFL